MNSIRPIVDTRDGRVHGRVVDGVYAFLGVPYAAPPFGADRLNPPRRPDSWSGVREATAFGAEVPQLKPDNPHWAALLPDPAVSGEDCLNLNIWTPELGSAALPVMVWIPGGMFEFGSGASYDGSRFARDGVVCVTINYRVGAEGFLYLDDGTANLGLLDEIAALRWVQQNIAAFGGSPDNVTVFGESAGAMSVGTLLGMPGADGLFRRAIAQSGAAHQATPATTALRIGRYFAEKLGVAATHEAVAAVATDRFLSAQAELKADLLAQPDPERWGAETVASTLLWQPVVDGDVIPDRPLARIAAGSAAHVDLLVGSNTEEWRLFLVVSGLIGQITEQILTGPVSVFGSMSLAAYGLPVDTALAAYWARYPEASPGDLLAAVQTDWWCRIPAIRLADAHVGPGAATYMYEFGWPSTAFDGLLGACHALEVAFVFDILGKQSEPLLGPEPPQLLADTMHAAWMSFASTGDCGWPRYDLTRRTTMCFNTTSHIATDPRAAERALWDGIR
ncbi:carboxylesterase family protein [Mycobacterium lentiflavum]|uniref:Carboxylic ester hydrolase n=1 Tax=Mycobacterium lentiflavum TaxID=141349 RepID=A0ABY3V605_MYCLN|nr:carboxylesterase family protein [Mycobacterium lentiflavum]ULP44640.2 carboxylesterase family protein [Mycobacterium lentiflavum]